MMQEDNNFFLFFTVEVSSLISSISQVIALSKPKVTVARNKISIGDRNGEKTLRQSVSGQTKPEWRGLIPGCLIVQRTYLDAVVLCNGHLV